VINAGLFSSAADDWETPQELFDELDAEFHFTLDPCCRPETAKCLRFFTQADDGLAQSWGTETVFVNPPYGRVIGKWVHKAFESALGGATCVLLIPARTDTAYWHDYCFKGEVRFLRGRVYFARGGKRGRAPFPSAVVIFRPGIGQ
jgi:phage N-6-adenine-methyltransferase